MLPLSRTRKRFMLEATVPEIASEIGDALHHVAEAIEQMSGVFAWVAAADNSATHGRQRDMAAVILRFSQEGFFSTRIDGEKVSEASQEMLDKMFSALFPNLDFKKMPKR